jgi:SAM-dependent methyltransferase
MNYPNFARFTDAVKKSPFQKKKLERYLASRDESFFIKAEEFSSLYINYLESENIEVEYAVAAYQKLCNDMMKCQIYFMKTGKYSNTSADAEEADKNIYSNEKVMKLYMIGLALSQFLWASHFEIYTCLIQNIEKRSGDIKSYLEIGPGHGFFLYKATELLKPSAVLTAVDISNTSIAITKSIINYLKPDQQNIEYHTADMLKLGLDKKYDFITMGEVLEHVNFPQELLKKLKDLLSDNGAAFVSTCVNCPAIDHVYHFKTVDEIRIMFKQCGLMIIDERVQPVEDLPMEEIVSKKITINYCAILKVA